MRKVMPILLLALLCGLLWASPCTANLFSCPNGTLTTNRSYCKRAAPDPVLSREDTHNLLDELDGVVGGTFPALDVPDSTFAGLPAATAGLIKRITDTGVLAIGDGNNFHCDTTKALKVASVICPPWGAATNGTTAAHVAVQNALNAGFSVVYFPDGKYLMNGDFTVPDNVTLLGPGITPFVNNTSITNVTANLPNYGAWIIVNTGAGLTTPAFLKMNEGSKIIGIGLSYPNQSASACCTTYPYTIASADTAAGRQMVVRDVLAVNPYNFINMQRMPASLIENVWAYPINIGIYGDTIFDVSWVRNIHFWPFWKEAFDLGYAVGSAREYTRDNGTALELRNVDDMHVQGLFGSGYRALVKLVAGVVVGDEGNAWAQLSQLTCDTCRYLIEGTAWDRIIAMNSFFNGVGTGDGSLIKLTGSANGGRFVFTSFEATSVDGHGIEINTSQAGAHGSQIVIGDGLIDGWGVGTAARSGIYVNFGDNAPRAMISNVILRGSNLLNATRGITYGQGRIFVLNTHINQLPAGAIGHYLTSTADDGIVIVGGRAVDAAGGSLTPIQIDAGAANFTLDAIQTANGAVVDNSGAVTKFIHAVQGLANFHSRSEAGTTNILDMARYTRFSTGTPAAGFGAGIVLGGDSATVDDRDMARLQARWTTATDASRTSVVDIQTVTAAGVLTTGLTIGEGIILKVLATAPTSPSVGTLYVDSTPAADELCFWDGAAWQGLSSGTDANCA